MVKADATRNYYADLGVSANADDNEIRKAFRQLALKCHPDRNPGREQESVAKFQQIQAAHEILSDPLQRAKYDSERRKYRNLNIPPYNPNTPRSRPPPPPRNAYTSTPSGSYYRAPPPKPPQAPQPPPQRPPPPQRHPTFASGADRFSHKNFRAPPTAQRPDQRQTDAAQDRANVFTAWQKMKQPRGEDTRAHNSTNPANPTTPNNPNGAPFGRSKSTRVPSKKGFDPGTPGQDEGQARSAYRSSYIRPDPSPTLAEDVPFAEGNRVRTPYHSAATGERTSMFGEGMGRSASVRNSPTNMSRPTSTEQGFWSDSGRRGQRNSQGGQTKAKPQTQPFPHMYVSSDEEEAESGKGRRYRGPPPARESPTQRPPWEGPVFDTPHKSGPANGVSPNPFKSKSAESINLKFSPSEWNGKFEGKPDYFAPNPQKGSSNKGRTSPSRGRPPQRTATIRNPASGQSQPPPMSPFTQPQTSGMPPPPPGPPPNAQAAFPPANPSTSHSAKFAPEDWAETFKEPSWAYPSKETSPRRGSTATKRTNANRKPSVVDVNGKAGQGEKTKTKNQAFAEDAINGDEDAMDLDDTPPLKPAKAGPVPSGAPPLSPPKSNGIGNAAARNGNASTSNPPKAPTGAFNGLSGLAAVEPFLPSSNGGLGGLGDLKDTLPFKSQPSNSHPTKSSTAQKLKFPQVPAAPAVPAKITQESVGSYFSQMEIYVRQYKAYNATLTKHFIARNEELENLDERCIHQRGETTQKLGFASYLKKMKEDEGVMEAWKVAQEWHIKALEQCAEVRNKAKQYLTSA